MIDVGRLCVKTAGRDATELCVVVEVIDNTFALVDGNTRRKKVNKAHLEALNKTLDVKKGADTKTVLAAFESAGIEVKKAAETKGAQEKKEQVKKVKKGTDKAEKEAKSAKKKTSKKKE